MFFFNRKPILLLSSAETLSHTVPTLLFLAVVEIIPLYTKAPQMEAHYIMVLNLDRNSEIGAPG